MDEIVDQLLRDKDFLLSKELKHKTEELNQLMIQAQRQNLKVELSTSELEIKPGTKVAWVDIKVYKEI